jgi:hypothetical protein
MRRTASSVSARVCAMIEIECRTLRIRSVGVLFVGHSFLRDATSTRDNFYDFFTPHCMLYEN